VTDRSLTGIIPRGISDWVRSPLVRRAAKHFGAIETRLYQSSRLVKLAQAAKLINGNRNSVVFVSPLLRAREMKMASALRRLGWKVVLVYKQTTPFVPGDYFDVAIRAENDAELHSITKELRPRVCHVFSGAVDEALLQICRDKPAPIVVDLNDVFCPSLFNYLHERFEPTRECLSLADGLCARDLQPKFAEHYDGFQIPSRNLLFPEYSWHNGPSDPGARKKGDSNEIRVVSVGTFCLETQGMYDSCYLQLARMLAEQKIHLHIYPHWFYRKAPGTAFNFDLKTDFRDFLQLEKETEYLHVHESLPIDELARELPQYDFGIVSGGCADFGQKLDFLTSNYMNACYSGRISDYLDARLPVLINHEVGFNYRILQRYGLGVDLNRLVRPGFHDELMQIKHGRTQARAVEHAAETLSLNRQAHRLADFYRTFIEEGQAASVRIPVWLRAAKRLPKIGPSARHLTGAIDMLNRRGAELERSAKENAKRSSQLRKQVAALQAKNESFAALDEQNKAKIAALQAQSDAEAATLRARIKALREELKIESVQVDELSGLLNWPEITKDVDRRNGFAELERLTQLTAQGAITSAVGENKRAAVKPISTAWTIINRKNLDQLLYDGYRNFKRTIALNYFTFPLQADDPQIAALEARLSKAQRERCWKLAQRLPDDPGFALANQVHYRYSVLLLWSYARSRDELGCLDRLKEPLEGNPIIVPDRGDSASQDLANSVLEYYAIREGVSFESCKRVLEIGGGYGRDAYVIMSLHPKLQYVFVDIPPAVYIAQRYLSSIFEDRTIFNVREFESYDEVRSEIEAASLIFLLPHQLQKLPSDWCDLVINISSFGEMTREQIKYYYSQIDRLAPGHFFTKQWKHSKNPFDGIVIDEADYPVLPGWKKLYSRSCTVQSDFFEALYEIRGKE